MFNVGPLELIVVLIIALIVLGPARLPEVARSVGRGMREFRNALDREHDDEDEEEKEEPEKDHHRLGTGEPAAAPATSPRYQKEADSSEPSSSSSDRV